MPTNNFQPFCPTDTGTNLLDIPTYTASAGRTQGNQPGIASSKLNNRAIRQSNVIASQFAQWVCNKIGVDMLDDGNLATTLTNITNALASIAPSRTVPTQTLYSTPGSFTYTFPANCLYVRARVQAAGGGGCGGGDTGGTNIGSPGTNGGASAITGYGTANGGSGGLFNVTTGGVGGTFSIAGGVIGFGLIGANGNSYPKSDPTNNQFGLPGGNSFFGGAGASIPSGFNTSLHAKANSGSGGAAGPIIGSNLCNAATSGAAGAFIELILPATLGTLPIVVGAKGSGGNGSAIGGKGGDGADGLIILDEFYQ